jgi:hypothetical protein
VRAEGGQTTVEWSALLLLAALAMGALAAVAPGMDGRSFGGFLAHRVVCAAAGGCDDGDESLRSAYGARDAALVRRHAPNLVYERGERQLPVDYRRCRARACAEASGDRDLDVHRSHSGQPATAFTRVIRRGGRVYLQYWIYFPDSNMSWAGSDRLWRLLPGRPPYPGFHLDDWEGFQLRIDPDGSLWARASSHGHYQGCKYLICRNRWIGATGWTRVSRGSHAGHIPVRVDWLGYLRGRRRDRPLTPGRDLRERTSTAEGLRLIALESLDRSGYRPLDARIRPPWRKSAYRDPESDAS